MCVRSGRHESSGTHCLANLFSQPMPGICCENLPGNSHAYPGELAAGLLEKSPGEFPGKSQGSSGQFLGNVQARFRARFGNCLESRREAAATRSCVYNLRYRMFVPALPPGSLFRLLVVGWQLGPSGTPFTRPCVSVGASVLLVLLVPRRFVLKR